jgi:hypothetical protein
MESKKNENTLKLLYYFIGLKIAAFGFIVSHLISAEYSLSNYFLIAALVPLLISILIMTFFIIWQVFKPEKEMIRRKKLRFIMGILGAMLGLVLALIIIWVLLYKEYLSL